MDCIYVIFLYVLYSFSCMMMAFHNSQNMQQATTEINIVVIDHPVLTS
jgi:hypothetical protein